MFKQPDTNKPKNSLLDFKIVKNNGDIKYYTQTPRGYALTKEPMLRNLSKKD